MILLFMPAFALGILAHQWQFSLPVAAALIVAVIWLNRKHKAGNGKSLDPLRVFAVVLLLLLLPGFIMINFIGGIARLDAYSLSAFAIVSACLCVAWRLSKKGMNLRTWFWGTLAALWPLASFASWSLSKTAMPQDEANLTWVGVPSPYVTGFPIRGVELPPGALGGDVVPTEFWPVVIVNEAFWLLAIALALIAAGRNERLRKIFSSRPFPWLGAAVLALLSVSARNALMLLWFD